MVLYTPLDVRDAFQEAVDDPQNADSAVELINGAVVIVSPGRTRYSSIGHLLVVAVHNFCERQGIPCYTSGGDGAYQIGEHVLAPDFAYKPTPMSDDYPDPVPPIWAVEVISPTDRAPAVRAKREIYQEAGILLWEVYPQAGSIDVYAPGQPMRTARRGDTLDAEAVLPGFSVALAKLLKR